MSAKQPFLLRPLRGSDISEYAGMLYNSFNSWYWKHGWGKDYFGCRPEETAIFFDIYNDLTPGKSIAVIDDKTGQMLGACFYHPREYHVSLGIMSVHPDHYKWEAVNVETHLKQVWGEFQPFKGVNMPSFLPVTG